MKMMKGRRFEKKIAHIVETKLYIGDLNSTGSHRLDDNGSPIWEETQGLPHLSITPISPQYKPHSLPLFASLLLLPSKMAARGHRQPSFEGRAAHAPGMMWHGPFPRSRYTVGHHSLETSPHPDIAEN